MSAREKLLAAFSHTADYHLDYTYPDLSNEEIADRLLSEHAHELAERLRNIHATDEGSGWNWWDAATIPASCADLIDPTTEEGNDQAQ